MAATKAATDVLVLLLVGTRGGGDRTPTSSRSSLVNDDNELLLCHGCGGGLAEFLHSFCAVAVVVGCFCCDRGEKEEELYVSSLGVVAVVD